MGADELDERLKRIAAVAQHYPKGSQGRNKAISRLLMAVERSERLCYSDQSSYSVEVYHEAMQALRLYVFKHIDAYDPSRTKILAWLNKKLDIALKEAIALHLKRQHHQATLEEDALPKAECPSPYNPLLSVQVRQIIEDDPDDIFKQRHVRGRPEVNFRAIALKTCSGYSRREIAAELGLQEQTLYSFFTRSCKSLKPLFDRYLKE